MVRKKGKSISKPTILFVWLGMALVLASVCDRKVAIKVDATATGDLSMSDRFEIQVIYAVALVGTQAADQLQSI